MNTSIRALAAVKELVYTGACHLDKLMHSEEGVAEILDTMSVLGIEVFINSFSLDSTGSFRKSDKSKKFVKISICSQIKFSQLF